MACLVCCIILLLVPKLAFTAEDNPRVKINQGELKGIYVTTRGGRQFSAFLGIPYARPPLQELRFANPQPPEPWEGIRDATKDGNMCIQVNVYNQSLKNVIGDEDCLYLNVYTPQITASSKFPVMFYIHGGGFFYGSGSSLLHGPSYIMDKDVILVAINYRLGPLGFLSMEDTVLPGNYGLKDQTAALRWIKHNIALFGGDPDSVTIFGESAGGASVHYHMMSPLTKGLFHRGIAQSGTALCSWASSPPGSYKNIAAKLASLVGCPSNPTTMMVDCLRNIPAYILTDLIQELNEWDVDPAVVFPPAVEPEGVEDAFITTDPWTVTTSLPLMTGFISEEGIIKAANVGSNPEKLEEFNSDYDRRGPLSMMFKDTADDPVRIAQIIRKFYFGEDAISEKNIKSLVDMYTDAWFAYCGAEAVRRHDGVAYYYYFNYMGSNSLAFQFGNISQYLGVCHTDELLYLFNMDLVLPVRNQSEADDQFSTKLIDLWTNFAIYGNPTPEGSDINWLPVKTSQNEYLHIKNDGFEMKTNLLMERDNFWQTLPFREKPTVLSTKKDAKEEL